MKTTVFTMFLRGWDIRNQQMFKSQIYHLKDVFNIPSAVDQSLSVFHDQSAIVQSAVD